MPNTFGTTGLQVELVDPRDARVNRRRFWREDVPELALANSLYVPRGRQASRGWVLLVRDEFDAVRSSGYGTGFQLQIDDFVNDPLTFKGLAIVQARCVSTGVTGDPKALYLVELTDARGVLSNQWFAFPTNSYYNVLSPAYPGDYYAASKNAGAAWTWDGMAGDLWTQMVAFLGTYPGLPPAALPAGEPVNWNFPGVPCWQALCAVLDHVGMTVAVNPASANAYSIVVRGSGDGPFAAAKTAAGLPEDDLEWIDVGSGRVPGSVNVYFRRVNQQYGTEETVRRDALQWATSAVYAVSVPAPSTFSGATGIGYLWDDFPVRYDVDGAPLAADVVTAATIAAERATQFYQDIYDGTLGYMRKTYAGALPFQTGSQVGGVCWKQDFAQGSGGWRTQVIRGELWKEVYSDR